MDRQRTMEEKARRPAWQRLLLALVVAIVTAEVVSIVALLALGTWPEASFRETYRSSGCLKANEFNYGRHARSQQEIDVLLSKIPHPFFGFTVNPVHTSLEWREHLISASYENELRYRVALGEDPRADDTFTIGVFGASVAGAFADHIIEDDAFARRLKSGVPALADKRIVIRNMAIGSSRQPAQLAIATQYMELLDMTINLDGYSEVAVVQYPQFPIEYPMFADVFFAEQGSSLYLRMRAGEEICRRISAPPRLFPPLGYSNFYYLVWSSLSRRLNATLYAPPTSSPQPDHAAFTDDEVRELYVDYFEKYTRYQHQLLTANGVRPYFFLQPNQYVEGSKPFSETEKRIAFGYGDAEELGRRYGRLRETVAELKGDDVAAFDLTMVFADETASVYIDNCCHVNALGNAIVAERVAEIIVREENRE